MSTTAQHSCHAKRLRKYPVMFRANPLEYIFEIWQEDREAYHGQLCSFSYMTKSVHLCLLTLTAG